jgi:UDP-GlcNAc:undecaprenyl-phosphate GlcNAc-1-phosphate transferase
VHAFAPITALWLVLLPMVDMFTIMYRRLKRGKSPMAPDRTHLHHILLRAGYKKKATLNIMLFVQVLFVCIGVLFVAWGIHESFSFVAALVFVGLYQLLMKRSWKFIRWSKRRFATA